MNNTRGRPSPRIRHLGREQGETEREGIIHRMESQGYVKGTVFSVPDAYTRNFMFRDLVPCPARKEAEK